MTETAVDVDIRGEDNLSPAANSAGKSVERLDKNIVKANRTAKGLITGFARLAQGTAQFTAGMKVMSGGLSGSIAGMTSLSNGLKNMARGLTAAIGVSGALATGLLAVASAAAVVVVSVGAITAAFVALGKSALRVGSFMEQANIALATFTGDVKLATKAMSIFREFARTTPFALPEIVSAGRQLLAYQFRLEDVQGVLRDAGDAAAGTGRGINELTRAFGRLKGGDFGEAFERFRDFGIDLRSLRPELFSTGRQFSGTADEAIDAIRLVIQKGAGQFKGFGGLMDKLAGSWMGIMSMMSDAWFNFLNAIADAGIFKALKDRAAKFLEEVNKLFEDCTIERWAQSISQALEILLKSLSELTPGGDTAAGMMKFFVSFGNTTIQVFARAIEGINLVIQGVGVVRMAWKDWRNDLLDMGKVDLAGPLLKGLWGIAKGFKGLMDVLGNQIFGFMLAIVQSVAGGVGKLLEDFFLIWKSAIVAPLIKELGSLFRWLGERVSGMMPGFGRFLDKLGNDLDDIVPPDIAPKGLMDGALETALDGWNAAWELAKENSQEGAAMMFEGFVSDPIEAAILALGNLQDAATNPETIAAIEELKVGLGNFARPLEGQADLIKEGFKDIESAAQETAEAVPGFWEQTWIDMKAGASTGLNDFVEELGTFEEAVGEATKGMLESVHEGVEEGLGSLIFGKGEKPYKRGIAALERARDETEIVIGSILQRQGELSDLEMASVEPEFETALSQDIGEDMKARIRSLQSDFAGIGAGTDKNMLLKKFDDIIDELAKSTGLSGRFHRAGKQMQNSLVGGFEENLTTLLANRITLGLLGLGGTVFSPITAGLTKAFADTVVPDKLTAIFSKDTSFTGLTGSMNTALAGVNPGDETFIGRVMQPDPDFSKTTSALDASFKAVSVPRDLDRILGSGTENANGPGRFDWIRNGINSAFSGVQTGLGFLWDAGTAPFNWIGDQLGTAFDSVNTENLNKFWTATQGTFNGLARGIGGVFGSVPTARFDKFWDADISTFGGMHDGLGAVFMGIDTSKLDRLWNVTSSSFSDMKRWLGDALNPDPDEDSLIKKIFGGTASAFDWMKSSLEAVFGGIDLSSFTDLFKSGGSVGGVLGNNAAAAIVAGFAGQAIGSQIGRMFGPGGEIGGQIGGGIASVLAVAAQANPLVAALSAVAGSIVGGAIGDLLSGDEKEKFQKKQPILQALFGQQGGLGGFIEQAGGASNVQGSIRGLGFEGAADVLGQDAGGINRWLEQIILSEGLATTKGDINALITQLTHGEGITASLGKSGAPVAAAGEFGEGDDLGIVPASEQGTPEAAMASKTFSFGASLDAMMGGHLNSFLESHGMVPGSAEFSNARAYINNGDNSGRSWLQSQGWTITARTGMRRVPGADGQAVPALLHGGESVLTASQTRAGDAGGGEVVINVNFTLNGLGDKQFLQMIKGVMPDIQTSVENSLQRKSRLGQFTIDSRAVRNVKTN